MERALTKPGEWHYEPKYNGWRALVHAPSGTMFNRHGQWLSIQPEFAAALASLRTLRLISEAGAVEWFDCEALERRHAIGRGALLVFDYITTSGGDGATGAVALLCMTSDTTPGIVRPATGGLVMCAATLSARFVASGRRSRSQGIARSETVLRFRSAPGAGSGNCLTDVRT